jgi:hypothetical protein
LRATARVTSEVLLKHGFCGSHPQPRSERPYTVNAALRRDSVTAHGARAAAGDASNRISRNLYGKLPAGDRLPPRAWRSRLRRGPQHTTKRRSLRAFLYLVFAVIEPSRTNKPAPRPLLSR